MQPQRWKGGLTRGAAGSAGCSEDRRSPDHLKEKCAEEHHGHITRGHHGIVRIDGQADSGVLFPGEPKPLVHQDPAHD